MIQWDDIRIFLSVAQQGSYSAAARDLNVNHSTISRRISQMETKLQARLFTRKQNGYRLTEAGETILRSAERMQMEFNSIERSIVGADNKLSGQVKLTAPEPLVSRILMPAIQEFLAQYPNIDLQLTSTINVMNLHKREADIAVRVSNDVPLYAIGQRLFPMANALYASHSYLKKHPQLNEITALVRMDQDGNKNRPEWLKNNFPHSKVIGQFSDFISRLEALKAGLGVAQIPCYVGDAEPSLCRIANTQAEPGTDIWLLSHTDTRHTPRIRLLMETIKAALYRNRSLIEGLNTRIES